MQKPYYILCIILLFLLSACGSNQQASDTGSISFKLQLSRPTATSRAAAATSADICIDYGITTINVNVVTSSGAAVAAENWSCSAHEGTVTNVPAGANYTVKLEGVDSNDTVAWTGEKKDISITGGSTTDAGTIIMTYVGSDTTPPTVSSTNPSTDAANIPVTSLLSATFSEHMATSTINMTIFKFHKDTTPVNGSVTYDANTMKAIFIPPANLSYLTTYTATITTGVQDMAGNNIQSDYSWIFTTEAPPSTVPSIPTGINATAGNSQVTITWDAVTDAAAYNIYWATEAGVTKTTGIKISGITSTSYIFTELTYNTNYYYVVTAVNSYGESNESSEIYAMLRPDDCTFSVSPASQVFPPEGGMGSANVSTQSGCSWAAESNNSWSTITSGSIGNDSGIVNYSVSVNTSTSPRSGTMAIAGLTFTVHQEADTTLPTNTTGSNCIDNGASSTNSTTVTLSLSAKDDIGITGYYVSENYTGTAPMNPSVSDPEWVPVLSAIDYTANVSYTFREKYPKGTGVYIYVWFKDAAGNISPVASDSIKYYQWTTSTIDSTGNVGEYASIAVDSNNKVHISYFDRTNNALKYATNKLGSWTTVTIDSGSSGSGVGMYTDLAIDSNDNIHLTYQGKEGLGYVTNITGTWIKSIIDSTGSNASIAIDSSNNVHISYFNGLNYLLKYATNISGSWVSSTIDNVGAFGRYSSIAIDSNNKVHISYMADLSNNRYVLKYAANSSGSWATAYIDDMEFGDTSIALDSNNKVHISYYSPKLKYATNISGSWAIQIIDETMGGYSSIAIDSNNKVHISYMGGSGTGHLKYVTNTLGPWLTSTLSNTREESTSIALDSNNNVHISSYGFKGYNDGDLTYTTDSGN